MKTLYISDLDGTLLNSESKLSDYTINTINALIDKGMIFSYATARSFESASVVAKGLTTNIPVIVYNGVFILNAGTGEIIYKQDFKENDREYVADFLIGLRVNPMVYAFINGVEHVSWLKGQENEGLLYYLSQRNGDKRLRGVTKITDLYLGDTFYFSCVGTKQELLPIYKRFVNDQRFTCILQQEIRRPEYWCEIMPREATKANAIKRLKKIIQCDRVVSFGDALNDIPMFKISDESYAVENAVDELKSIATCVIRSNDEDGVARWLNENYDP